MTDKRAAFVGCGLNEGEGKPVEGGLPVSLVIAPRSNARTGSAKYAARELQLHMSMFIRPH